MIIVILIVIAIFVHNNINNNCKLPKSINNSDNIDTFDNIDFDNNIQIANITQDYKCIPKQIINQKQFTKAPQCETNKIQIGEYCKNYKSDIYRRICLDDEKFSDGICVKDCQKDEHETGNPHICLSKCPDGYLDDGYNCCQIKYIFNK